nr:unnamed protein product [Callosobruchus analis]CAI5841325.1 unnamed protein product [Callosobruchus analis]
MQTDNYINSKLDEELASQQQWSNWVDDDEPVLEPIAEQYVPIPSYTPASHSLPRTSLFCGRECPADCLTSAAPGAAPSMNRSAIAALAGAGSAS